MTKPLLILLLIALIMQSYSCDNKSISDKNTTVRTITPDDIDTVNNCGITIEDTLTIAKLTSALKNKPNLTRNTDEEQLLFDVLVELDDKGFLQKISKDTLIFIIQNCKRKTNRIRFSECNIQQEDILRKYPKSFKQKIFLMYFTECITTLDSIQYYKPRRVTLIGNSY